MEISAFPTSTPTPTAKPAASPRRSDASAAASGASAAPSAGRPANLGNFQSVQQAMNNLPDSRADAVARGKALASSPNWPGAEIIHKLAEMFIADAGSAPAAN